MSVEKNSVVLIEREFNAPASKVFKAVKEGRLFFNCGAWSDGTAIDFRVGGNFQLSFAHYGSTYGEFTEVVENKRVAFTWNSDGMNIRSRVTLEFIAQGSSCTLKLRHEGFADQEQAEMHNEGWTEGLSGFTDELLKNKLRIEREFLAPVEILYEACSGLRFLSHLGATSAPSQIDFRVGGKYNCKLENGKSVEGEFLEIVKNKKIAFTWEKATTVSMNFGPWGEDGKHSYLELLHEGFADAESTWAHHSGWNGMLSKVYKQTAL